MTLKEILTNVLNYMGEEPADTYVTNLDSDYSRLVTFVNSAAQDILKAHDWSLLKRQATISIIEGTTLYDLPSDYDRMISNTSWSNDRHIRVPTTDRVIVISKKFGNTYNYQGRLYGGQIEFIEVPEGDITFDYISKNTINFVNGAKTGSKQRFTADSDEWILDTELLERMTRQRYSMQAGEQDPSAAQDVSNRFKKLILADVGVRRFNTTKSDDYEMQAPRVIGT